MTQHLIELNHQNILEAEKQVKPVPINAKYMRIHDSKIFYRGKKEQVLYINKIEVILYYKNRMIQTISIDSNKTLSLLIEDTLFYQINLVEFNLPFTLEVIFTEDQTDIDICNANQLKEPNEGKFEYKKNRYLYPRG